MESVATCRQGPRIVSQLAHVERFSQKTPTYVILLSMSHGNSCFAFVNGSSQTIACGPTKIFPLHCLSPKLITVRLSLAEESKAGWDEGWGWVDGMEGRVLFLFHHIPTHHSLKQNGLVLIHFSPSESSPPKHLSTAASFFQSREKPSTELYN